MEGEDMKGNTQDLTKGSIVKAIILFSVPLLIGNLFQQLYNAVDSYVVGNYVGKVAVLFTSSLYFDVIFLKAGFIGAFTADLLLPNAYFIRACTDFSI